MAPFDFNYVEDDFGNGAAGTVAAPVASVAVTWHRAELDMRPAAPRRPVNEVPVASPFPVPPPPVWAYPLTIDASILVSEAERVAAAKCLTSMRTHSYAEYLLQVLDKNATMTSIVFILAYAGLLTSM